MATQPVQPTQQPQLPNSFAPIPTGAQGACPPGEIRIAGQCRQVWTSQGPGAPAPGGAGGGGERQQRFTAGQRAEQAGLRRQRTGAAKYGQSFLGQGLRPVKEQGQAFLARSAAKQATGAGTPVSWDYIVRDGKFWVRPMPKQTGRINEFKARGLDPSQYAPADQVMSAGQAAFMQRGLDNPQRRAFNAAHPELAGTPGGGRDAFLHQRFLDNLKTDPGTGFRVNRQGELYDPSNQVLTNPGFRGGAVGQQGVGIDFASLRPTSPLPGQPASPMPGGPAGRPSAGPLPGAPAPTPGAPGAPGAAPTAPGGAPGTPAPSGDPLQDEITGYLRQIMGQGGPFGQGETDAARAALRSATEGGVGRAREEAQFDAIRSGMARSPAAQRRLADIRRGAEADYSRGSTQIRLEHAEKNFNARMQALSGMSSQLQSARQFAIAQAQTELERTRIAQNYDIALRNITLAQQQLRQQMAQFTSSQAQQASQFGQSLGQRQYEYQTGFDWARQQGSCPVQQADGTTVTVPIPCSQLAGGFL